MAGRKRRQMIIDRLLANARDCDKMKTRLNYIALTYGDENPGLQLEIRAMMVMLDEVAKVFINFRKEKA
tara:strand:- start:5 stop:211 length:207 start_codon:yes stop_codon:yes gene_type:complete